MDHKYTSLSKDKKALFITFLFIIFAIWRGVLFYFGPYEEFNVWSFAWGTTYQLLALIGGIIGFSVAKEWGGWKSTFGKAISLFSVGLLLQSFGQAVSSYYVFTTGEVPYPGIGDIGFFGSVMFYIFGVALLSKVTGVRAYFKSNINKLVTILVPILLVGGSYYLFLNGYQYDWSNSLQTFLDFSYPVYQAIYVAIAILTLIVARKYLGGMMKGPVILLLLALVMQYLSDFVFLYQASRELYIPEGINDCMYFVSYFLMALALIYIGNTFKKISNS
jgi:hypothetical protein